MVQVSSLFIASLMASLLPFFAGGFLYPEANDLLPLQIKSLKAIYGCNQTCKAIKGLLALALTS